MLKTVSSPQGFPQPVENAVENFPKAENFVDKNLFL
jgi:hypothetical protein